MSSDNSTWNNCSMMVPNCKEGDIPIGELCYPTTSSNSNCTTFQHINLQKGDTPIKGEILSENQGVDIQECLDSAMYMDGVTSVIYNDSSRNNIPEGEQCQENTCYILGQDSVDAKELPTNLCNQYIFSKNVNDSSCMTIKSTSDDNKKVDYSIDYSKGYEPPGSDVLRTGGDYVGSSCRQKIVTTDGISTNAPSGSDYSPMLIEFGDWCKKNPNKKICSQFCNNVDYAQYCGIYTPWEIVISIGLFLVILFITLMLYKKHKNGWILTVGLGISSLIFIWFIFTVVIFIKNKGTFHGNDPDFPSSPDDELNLESNLKTAPNYLCEQGNGGKVDYNNTDCPAPSCCNVTTLTNLDKNCTASGVGEYGCFSDSDCPNSSSTGSSKCVSSSSLCKECKCNYNNKKIKNKKNDGSCAGTCIGQEGCDDLGLGLCDPVQSKNNNCAPGFNASTSCVKNTCRDCSCTID